MMLIRSQRWLWLHALFAQIVGDGREDAAVALGAFQFRGAMPLGMVQGGAIDQKRVLDIVEQARGLCRRQAQMNVHNAPPRGG